MPGHDVRRAIESGQERDLQAGKVADVRLAQRHRAECAPWHVEVLERRADQCDGGDDGVGGEELVELLLALQIGVSKEHGGNGCAIDEETERRRLPSCHAVREQPAQRAEDDEQKDEQRPGINVREAPAELPGIALQRRKRRDQDHRVDQHDAERDGHGRARRHLAHGVLQHAADDGHEPSAPPVDERDGHRQQHEAGVNDEDHVDSWPLAVGCWLLNTGPLQPIRPRLYQLSTTNCQPTSVRPATVAAPAACRAPRRRSSTG